MNSEFLDLPDEVIALILRHTVIPLQIPHMRLRLICRLIRDILDGEWSYLYQPIQYVGVDGDLISYNISHVVNKLAGTFLHTSPNRSPLSQNTSQGLRRGGLYLYWKHVGVKYKTPAVTYHREYPSYRTGQSTAIPDDIYAYQVFTKGARFYLKRKYHGRVPEEDLLGTPEDRVITPKRLD